MQTTPHYIALFLIATILVMSTLLGILMGLVLINQKRHEVYQSSLGALQAQYTHSLLLTQVESQEQTFKNIAQEIHDNINLSLTLSKLTLHQLAEPNPPEDLVERSLGYISDAIRDLSAISRGLNAEIIHQQGLFNALNEEILRVERSSRLRTEFVVEGEPAFLSAQGELLVFRTIQESFNNILKHARASSARLQIVFCSQWIKVEMRDDGIGFDPETLSEKAGKSTGLLTIKSRVELFGGSFLVESAPGSGTRFYFELPINDHDTETNLPDRPGGRPHLGTQRPGPADQRV
ncbi:sensor histidine kinase [Flaviaesturariibacter amylovorans]|uniref:histidine kinase n=1 Tax=Flaviaesturariibacter amylovorans TaxID=1084520 RepID=A0ABP8G9A3_9BACT